MIFGNDKMIFIDGATYIRVGELGRLKEDFVKNLLDLHVKNSAVNARELNLYFVKLDKTLDNFIEEIKEECYKEHNEYLSKLNG
jgi:hypothetical protein